MIKSSRLSIFYIILYLSVFNSGCEKSTDPDNTSPSIVILQPIPGSTLTGPTSIVVAASDDEGISEIQIFVDDERIGILKNSDQIFKWNVGYWADGQNHTLLAIAKDKSGNEGQSNPVTVTVSETAIIFPQLLNPTNETTYPKEEQILFSWSNLQDVESFELAVSSDPGFSIISIYEFLTDTFFTETSLESGVYYWHVRGKNDVNKYSAWSESYLFAKGDAFIFGVWESKIDIDGSLLEYAPADNPDQGVDLRAIGAEMKINLNVDSTYSLTFVDPINGPDTDQDIFSMDEENSILTLKSDTDENIIFEYEIENNDTLTLVTLSEFDFTLQGNDPVPAIVTIILKKTS